MSFELSTPFGNIAWFFRFLPAFANVPDILVTINKLLFAVSFVGARLIFGVYWSYWFFVDCFASLDRLEAANDPSYASEKFILSFFMLGNLVLNALNFFWFIKIVFWVKK